MVVNKEHDATRAVITNSLIVLQEKENIASIQKGAILPTMGNHLTMHYIC